MDYGSPIVKMEGSMKIEKIDLFHVSLPTRRSHKWKGLTGEIGGYVLLRVTGSRGFVGWGEAPAIKDWGGDHGKYYGETPGTTRHVLQTCIAPAVIGAEVNNPAMLHVLMDRAIKGYPYAKASLEMAVYDLLGRALGVPVYTLLGGRCAPGDASLYRPCFDSGRSTARAVGRHLL
mgnify:CR=1 FL=1